MAGASPNIKPCVRISRESFSGVISERTKVGLASARARGRKGGGQYKMTSAKLRLAMAAMGQRQTVVSELCKELGVTRQTLYRHLGPDGSLREDVLAT